MKIADLKQPYKRMAEYLAEKNTDERFYDKELLIYSFYWHKTNYKFWNEVYYNNHPEITEEIKKYFPPDFDFSGEEVKTKPVMQMLDTETQKYIYTQLAKEGKFDELPDTCEFSEAVELEVCDGGTINQIAKVIGKFKGKFVEKEDISRNGYTFWNFAQLSTPKIDFSEFKSGDVVEVELSNEEKRIGWFDYVDNNNVVINILKRKGNQVCNGGSSAGNKMLNKEKIKSITKIK